LHNPAATGHLRRLRAARDDPGHSPQKKMIARKMANLTFHHLANKAALVGAVAVRHTEAMAAIVDAGVRAAVDDQLPDLVKTLIRSTMQAHAENPKLRRAIIEELPRIGRPARLAELTQNIRRSVEALLAAHHSRIKVKDISMAAFVIVNTMEHLTHVAETSNLGRASSDGWNGN
jgi:hypothetical protein